MHSHLPAQFWAKNGSWLFKLLCLVALFAAWILWYCIVLYPASRSARTFGPLWLRCLQSRVAKWIGERICGLSFACNADEESEGSSVGVHVLPSLKAHIHSQQLMVFHPHGAYMMTSALFGGHVFYEHAHDDMQHKVFAAVANLLFRVPLLSEYLLVNGARSADRATLCNLLDAGHSVSIQPGGIYEQVRSDADREVAYFPSNLGFVRLAIQFGIPLVPVYIFGENQLLRQNSFTSAANQLLYEYFGVGTLFVIGKCGLPWVCLRSRSVFWHFGRPVDVGPAVLDPTDSQVHGAFRNYVAELRETFCNHAQSHLPPEVASQGLFVVWRGHEHEPL